VTTATGHGAVQPSLGGLVHLLDLEQVDALVFRGPPPNDVKRQVFGGQVIAQSLMAASRTVEAGRAVHSLHSYFLLSGDPTLPIVFLVERVRDGRSYTTRKVVARQNGRDIFILTASFHVSEEGVEHRPPSPIGQVPHAEDLEPTRFQPGFLHPIDMRPVPAGAAPGTTGRPVRHVWARADSALPEDPIIHTGSVAYASDLTMLVTALVPHALVAGSPDVMMASLDHSMWFHRPFRGDEWLLHETESPIAHGGRALTRGEIYDQAGHLVASIAQEGVLRRRRSS
jgi:acyl-CoA thioesterase-2